MSPVDARRVILIDGQIGSGSGAGGQTTIGAYVFLIPFLATVALLGITALREDWANTTPAKKKDDENDRIDDDISSLHKNPLDPFRTFVVEMRRGGALTENKSRRLFTLCILYFAQGLPWGFASVTFAAYLVDNGVAIGDVAILLSLIHI